MLLGLGPMPPCGFGNRLFNYYNFRQEAARQNIGYFAVPWEGHQLFEGNMLGQYPPPGNFQVFNFCLGERFFDKGPLSTRDVFKLRAEPHSSGTTCAIHFRGTDFHQWNPDSILDTEYYLQSIEETKSAVDHYILFTDDKSLKSYSAVVKYLRDNSLSLQFNTGSPKRSQYAEDFVAMCGSDYIISSPSTFCISAGFIGKQKKIVHSKEWILGRMEKQDKFWIDLYNGGNHDYKLWKII
tara:strand:- start:2828 stop:3544 length:717 start_codon:yes stop_codon:yes gene_type:complete